MSAAVASTTPGLALYLKSLKGKPADASVEYLSSLLKRRQIRNARPCAIATTHLLLQVVASFKIKSIDGLIERIREVGRRLINAQPLEPVVGNIVRRVLGLIREVTDPEGATNDDTTTENLQKGPPQQTQQSVLVNSLFNLMSNPHLIAESSPGELNTATATESSDDGPQMSMRDVKDDVLNGIREMLDELDQADDQIAGYALDHIHSHQVILTSSASTTVQKFLLAAAKRRKFSVIYAESYPNEHEQTHQMALSGRKHDAADEHEPDHRFKPLTSAGIRVTVIPDSNIWAVMSRVNQVILPAQCVYANGGFVGAAGAKMVAAAAQYHRIPVLVLSGVYRLTPVFVVQPESCIQYGEPAKVLEYSKHALTPDLQVSNPLQDYVSPELVSLFITNLGGHSPSYLYRISADHYDEDDIEI